MQSCIYYFAFLPLKSMPLIFFAPSSIHPSIHPSLSFSLPSHYFLIGKWERRGQARGGGGGRKEDGQVSSCPVFSFGCLTLICSNVTCSRMPEVHRELHTDMSAVLKVLEVCVKHFHVYSPLNPSSFSDCSLTADEFQPNTLIVLEKTNGIKSRLLLFIDSTSFSLHQSHFLHLCFGCGFLIRSHC